MPNVAFCLETNTFGLLRTRFFGLPKNRKPKGEYGKATINCKPPNHVKYLKKTARLSYFAQ